MPARSVLMVSPAGFRPDLETASDNGFQLPAEDMALVDIQQAALKEFSAVTAALTEKGIEVAVFDGNPEHPSAVFPNNWFSTDEDGTVVFYPMSTPGRRLERRPEIVSWLEAKYPQSVDLSYLEDRDGFLEGTGSLVLDSENRIAYAARSKRTSAELVVNWCADFEYEPVLFDTTGPRGLPVYHTNVLMALGTGYAIVCTECISNPLPVISALLATGRELIEITRTQMASFCGNVLELQGETRLLVMSSSARDSFTSTQLQSIEERVQTLSVEVPTIERFGGGGVRCMLAELY